MKKTIVWLLLVLFMSFGCTKKLEDRMSSLEDRVNALELLCERMSEDISSLRTIISAVQEGDCILSVEPIMENEIVVGYVITFSKSGEIKIYNGKDGYSPLVSIEKDLYGDYYWTLDGEWMLDEEGQRISAEGMTPDFKIIDGSLYMSFDNWNSRTLLGKVEGDSFFRSVDVTDEEVTFTLTDGRTFTIGKAKPLSIEFDVEDMVAMDVNSSREIGYTVQSGSQTIVVEVISSSDIKAKVRKTSSLTGSIVVTTGQTIDEYSKVVVLVSDGAQLIMRTIRFEPYGLVVSGSNTIEVGSSGGDVELNFLSNVEYRTVIAFPTNEWISRNDATKSLAPQSVSLSVKRNSGSVREGEVIVQSLEGNLSLKYTIRQEAEPFVAERDALKAIYKAYYGNNVIHNSGSWKNWNDDQIPVSEWSGVTTDEMGHVVSLLLIGGEQQSPSPFGEYKPVNVSLPPEIKDLVYLKDLQIGRYFYKSFDSKSKFIFPLEIGELTSLETMLLCDNADYSFPAEMSGFPNLKRMDISCSQLSLPLETAKLPNLESLKIYYADECPVPEGIGSLPKLQKLVLQNISGPLPYEIGNLSTLTLLYLTFADKAPGPIPVGIIGRLSNLTWVGLTGNFSSIPSEISQWVTSMPQLTLLSLDIRGEPNVTVPPELAEFYNLASDASHFQFYLRGSGLTGTLPEEMLDCKSRHFLQYAISGTNITGKMPDFSFARIGTLDLSDNDFTEWSGSNTVYCERLDLSENQLSAELSDILGCFYEEDLVSIDLHGNQISGGLDIIKPNHSPFAWSSMTKLELFDVSDNLLSGEVTPFYAVPEASSGGMNVRYDALAVNLANNNMTGCPSEFFNGLYSYYVVLSELHLNGNRFSGTIEVIGGPYPYGGPDYKVDWVKDVLPQQDGYELIIMDRQGNQYFSDFYEYPEMYE